MSFWDDIGDALKFEKFQLEEWWDGIKENPEQLLLGAADPVGAELWGGITGKDYQPMVSEWGGPTEETFAKAEAEGIDTESAGKIHEVAEGIAQAYAMDWGFGELGEFMGGKDVDPDMFKQGYQQFQNSMQQQQQAELDKPMDVPPPGQQPPPPGQTFGPPPAPGMAVAPPGTAILPEPSLPPEPVQQETFPRRM
jgi:hypothetical protein